MQKNNSIKKILLSCVLIFSMLDLHIQNKSTRALQIERTYSTSMNVKESILVSLNQGATDGFLDYDLSHDVLLCKHCPDNYCSPEPIAPNHCDPGLCEQCFRADEAKDASESQALLNYEKLESHDFDPDFDIFISNPEIQIFLQQNPLSKNGYSYHSFRLEKDVAIAIHGFDTVSSAKIPRGVIHDHN